MKKVRPPVRKSKETRAYRNSMGGTDTSWTRLSKQLMASAFFGVSSILIITINKAVLTTFKFPSFQVVGLGQMVAILIICWSCRMAKVVDFPPPSITQITKVFPLPIIYIVNLIFGLGSTQKLKEKLAQQVKDTLPTSLTSYKTTSTVVTLRGKQETPVGKPSSKPAASPLSDTKGQHGSQGEDEMFAKERASLANESERLVGELMGTPPHTSQASQPPRSHTSPSPHPPKRHTSQSPHAHTPTSSM